MPKLSPLQLHNIYEGQILYQCDDILDLIELISFFYLLTHRLLIAIIQYPHHFILQINKVM